MSNTFKFINRVKVISNKTPLDVIFVEIQKQILNFIWKNKKQPKLLGHDTTFFQSFEEYTLPSLELSFLQK